MNLSVRIYKYLISAFAMLLLIGCDTGQLNSPGKDDLKIPEFARSDAFKTLTEAAEKMLRIQSMHYRSLDRSERKNYNIKLAKYAVH